MEITKDTLIYKTKDGKKTLEVLNQKALDFDLTVKYEGVEYHFDKFQAPKKPVKGSIYLRTMTYPERLRYGEEMAKNAFNTALKTKQIIAPPSSDKQAVLNFEFAAKKAIVKEGMNQAKKLKGKLVIETW